MIDTKELRRLAQAATPGPWINYGRQPNVAGLPHSAVAAKTLLARVYSEAYGDVEQETANATFIAAANPAAISELLGRLEAAEKDIALKERIIDALGAELNSVAKERDALRAKITEMKQQEPVAYLPLSSARMLESGVIASGVVWNCRDKAASDIPLYARPGAQPAPSHALDDNATIAGLESAVTHLSVLLDSFRALLVEVNDVCGRDGHGGQLEDGESEIIDKVRAAISMTEAPPCAKGEEK